MKAFMQVARKQIPADMVIYNARIVNVFSKQVLSGEIAIYRNRIAGIAYRDRGEIPYAGVREIDAQGAYVIPGLIDAHLHIESSMVTPTVLSSVLLSHGVTSAVCDPHEIANATGTEGIDFMLEDAEKADVDYFFMIPSSVPSCDFETNGAGEFLASDMNSYLSRNNVLGLAEVMRFTDVLDMDQRMEDKLTLFDHGRGKWILDGHAPGLSRADLQAYRAAGISNDHEAVNAYEAIERIQNGFQLFIREGSGARNLEGLLGGLLAHGMPLNHCSFCTDDKHIEDMIEEGTIDWCLRKAVAMGTDPIDAIMMGTINTAMHYGLKSKGAIAPGYDADLVIVNDLKSFEILDVIKDGVSVSDETFGNHKIEQPAVPETLKKYALEESVKLPRLNVSDIEDALDRRHLIEVVDGQLLTIHRDALQEPDLLYEDDLNLVVAVERYGKSGQFAAGLLKGFCLKGGAIAASYAHDSHNVIAAGDSAQDIVIALNELERIQGGFVLVENGSVYQSLALPVAGLMSAEPAQKVSETADRMKEKAREMGVPKTIDPFAHLSFLSLPVIPEIRITPQGMYDVVHQCFFSETDKQNLDG